MSEKHVSKSDEHGTGAVKHPNYENRDIYSAEELGIAPAPDFTKSTGLTEPPDEDQGSSSSCTSQAHGYYIWQLTGGMQLLREDTYSHTRLPGGGAYLNAPGNLGLNYGVLARSSKYPEPSPETEANMSKIILALDAEGRQHFFMYKVLNITVDLNTIASVLEQYKGAIIGINGNNPGWVNMVDPTYNGQPVWGHALYAYDRAVRNGKNAIKEKSSWCTTGVKDHYINSDYFANGGVFEALVYANFQEVNMSEIKIVLSKDGQTVYKCEPIVDMDELNAMASVEGFVVPSPIPPSSSL
jgi:hypothetical protein